MEHSLNLPNRFAMILDTETINSVIAHAAQLNLSRRECHPLQKREPRTGEVRCRSGSRAGDV